MSENCFNCDAQLPNRPEDLTEIFCAACGEAQPSLRMETEAESVVAHTAKQDLIAGPENAPEIPFGAASLCFGYDQSNDIVIPLSQVSGRHAEIAAVGNRFILKDLGSTNGVYINGTRISRAYVKLNDIIGLGSYEFPFTTPISSRLSNPKNKSTQAIHIPDSLGKIVVIGRDPECDISIDIPQISRKHAEFKWNGKEWQLKDLDTINGTFVNDRQRPIKRAIVSENDIVFFGSYRFNVDRLSSFVSSKNFAISGDLVIPENKDVIIIGRGDENDIVIDSPQISRKHAKIIKRKSTIVVEDLGSANGTYVDGVAISKSTVQPGQTISFGSYTLVFDKNGELVKGRSGDVSVQVDSVSVVAPSRKVLDDVSFTAYPSELVGILGPSGSGKTTLLMSIIGELTPTTGTTRLNGLELQKNAARFRGSIGYLPQDDIIHPELTVYESLFHAAKLRLPPDTSNKEIRSRITTILQSLELQNIVNVRIGSAEKKGISGGQRKRVNLAMELLIEPYLLCLDEPTSGLASEDALTVMRVLKKLSADGRTILLTIHQPSLRVYRELDNALYMANGKLVYYGPSYPESIQYFCPEIDPASPEGAAIMADPGSCMTPIVEAGRNNADAELVQNFRDSRFYSEFVVNRATRKSLNVGKGKRPRLFFFRQFITLSHRYLRTKLRDKIGMTILLIQAPIIGLLLDLVFAKESGVFARLSDIPFALFLIVVSSIWFGCSNAAREIVRERTIFRRERMIGLSIPAYVASKYVILASLSFFQCAMLIGVTYLAIDLQGNPGLHLLTLWLCSNVGIGMGLLLSSLVRSVDGATASVPLLLIPQIILGGAIMPLERMSAPIQGMTYGVVSRYGFEALLHTEDNGEAYEIAAKDLPKPIAPGLPALPPPPHPVDRFIGDHAVDIPFNYCVLLGFNFLLYCMTGLSIAYYSRKRIHL